MPTRISYLHGIGIEPVSITAIITGATQIISSIINKANGRPGGGDMPDILKRQWIEAQLKNYAGRFSEETNIWPVPGEFIPQDWIAEQVVEHNFHGGYEILDKVVAQKGTADGRAYKAKNYPYVPGGNPSNDPLQAGGTNTVLMLLLGLGVAGYFIFKR